MKKMIVFAACMVLVATAAFAGIANTKHDLGSGSTSGGYTVTGTSEICVFCHTPHGAQNNTTAPLWNRSSTSGPFTMYSGVATMNATLPGTTTLSGTSLACMSCHDGQLALAASTINIPNSSAGLSNGSNGGNVVAGQITGMPNLGTDLSNDHPVNFTYQDSRTNGDTGLNAAPIPASGATLINGMVECASCHQVHSNAFPPFLRGTMERSALCLGCHTK